MNPEARHFGFESERPPVATVSGVGPAAQLTVQADEDHQSPTVARTTDGWALSWGDRDHSRAFFVRLDSRGAPIGRPVVVRESRTAEEDVWSPAIAFTGQDYGVSWVDPANGRVRFARFDASGNPVGRATIVHEGLEMPLASRVVWNGNEFGVAVAMDQGVYFARVDRQGSRVGQGVIVAEGQTVASLEDLSVSSGGFAVVWRGGERGSSHRVQLSRDGRPLQSTGARAVSAGIRLASR